MFEYWLKSSGIGYIAEFLPILAGAVYLAITPNPEKNIQRFWYYMWFVLVSEIIGFYTTYAYLTNYVTLPFIKETPFTRSYWLYNIYGLVSVSAFTLFFRANIRSKKIRKYIKYALLLFLLSAILFLIFSGVYLYRFSPFGNVVGTFLISLCIIWYFWELLKSSEILVFYKNFTFYVAIGALVRYLVVMPIFIYDNYFTLKNPEFINIFQYILTAANIFMYGCFTIGFILCYQKKNFYSSSISPS